MYGENRRTAEMCIRDRFISTTDRGIVDYQWFTEVSFKNALMQQEDYHKMAAELKKPEYHILAVDNYGRKREGIPVSYTHLDVYKRQHSRSVRV